MELTDDMMWVTSVDAALDGHVKYVSPVGETGIDEPLLQKW